MLLVLIFPLLGGVVALVVGEATEARHAIAYGIGSQGALASWAKGSGIPQPVVAERA